MHLNSKKIQSDAHRIVGLALTRFSFCLVFHPVAQEQVKL
jgi:hypothetical protein